MKIVMLGTGAAIPDADRNDSAIVINVRDDDSARLLLREPFTARAANAVCGPCYNNDLVLK